MTLFVVPTLYCMHEEWKLALRRDAEPEGAEPEPVTEPLVPVEV